jgi:hypothetical protein
MSSVKFILVPLPPTVNLYIFSLSQFIRNLVVEFNIQTDSTTGSHQINSLSLFDEAKNIRNQSITWLITSLRGQNLGVGKKP